jgi:hypothetical protein
MQSPTYILFRNAILTEQQVVCLYAGRIRELCPHIIGTNRRGEEVVLAWQFGGDSSGPLPQWRWLTSATPACAPVVGTKAAHTARRRPASVTSTSTSTLMSAGCGEVSRTCFTLAYDVQGGFANDDFRKRSH